MRRRSPNDLRVVPDLAFHVIWGLALIKAPVHLRHQSVLPPFRVDPLVVPHLDEVRQHVSGVARRRAHGKVLAPTELLVARRIVSPHALVSVSLGLGSERVVPIKPLHVGRRAWRRDLGGK